MDRPNPSSLDSIDWAAVVAELNGDRQATQGASGNAPTGSSSSGAAFGPLFVVARGQRTDITLITADRSQLFAHIGCLLQASSNNFGGVLGNLRANGTVPVAERAKEMSIVLHIIYGMPCTHLGSTLQDIERAIGALIKYGVAVQNLAAPNLPLYQLVMTQAPLEPIEAYALAGHHELERLAVAISSHLLAYDTSNLSDALCVKMGPVYLMRLVDLHRTRRNALRAIVLKAPATHPPTATCRDGGQGQLAQAWAFVAAELAWDRGVTHISTYALQSAFQKAGASISCYECKRMLQDRITAVTREWSQVKRGI